MPLLCCIKENQPFQIQALCGPSSKSIRSTVFILVQQVSEPLEDRTMKETGSESTTLQVSIIFLWPDKDAISLHTNGSEKMLEFLLTIIIGRQNVDGSSVVITRTCTPSLLKPVVPLSQHRGLRLKLSTSTTSLLELES